jgi:hypothetical protein
MQSVVLRHRTLEATSHRLELSIRGDRCQARISRLVQEGPITAEFPLECLTALPDLSVGAIFRAGKFKFERLSDVYRLRYRDGSMERDCMFVSREELDLALLRLREEKRRRATAA